jgi:hypothetical protein
MMDYSDLERRYTQILNTVPPGARQIGTGERRKAPRVPVTSAPFTAAFTDLGVRTVMAVRTKDISTSGVCFFSEQPFPSGAEIDLTVANVFSLSAVVVSCEMEETDASFLEVRYCVRCQFVNERQGMEVLVLAKEIEMTPPPTETR